MAKAKKAKEAKPTTETGEAVNISKVENELKVYETELLTEQAKAEAVVIASDDDYNMATEYISALNTKKKQLEKLRKFFVEPLNQQVKNINAMFKPQVEAHDGVIQIIKGKMASYFDKKEKERITEEKRLQAIREKANEKRAEQGKEAIAEPVREVAEVQKTASVGAAQTTARKVWKHKVISMDKLPEDIKKAIWAEAYKKGIVDQVVRKFVMAGMHEISGVEVYQETEIAVRK